MLNFYFSPIVLDQNCCLANIDLVYRYVPFKAAASKNKSLVKTKLKIVERIFILKCKVFIFVVNILFYFLYFIFHLDVN